MLDENICSSVWKKGFHPICKEIRGFQINYKPWLIGTGYIYGKEGKSDDEERIF